ncbi:MAG: NlpC/P60 family protein, partial [Rhodococcus sp. (in: high G+C Gram-positive bacteria)]
ADQYRLFPKELPTHIPLTGAAEAQAAIDNFIRNNTGKSVDIMQNVYTQPVGPAMPTSLEGMYGVPAGRAEGGPITGGIPGKDSVPILAMPGEHVLTTADVDRLGGQAGAYRFRAALAQGKVGKFAAGGAVGEAVDAARSVTGVKYKWGGVGPDGFDCSGFVGWLQQILMGFGKATSRIYTTYSLIGGATAGLAKGLNSASPFNVGVSEEHMAATLDGQPVESGGSHGDSRIGAPAVGANDGQFPYKFHLPLDKIAGGYSPGSGTSANQYS